LAPPGEYRELVCGGGSAAFCGGGSAACPYRYNVLQSIQQNAGMVHMSHHIMPVSAHAFSV